MAKTVKKANAHVPALEALKAAGLDVRFWGYEKQDGVILKLADGSELILKARVKTVVTPDDEWSCATNDEVRAVRAARKADTVEGDEA